jgi:V8-like Glu-specific endopeptidase
LDYTCIEILKEDNIKQFFKIYEYIIENDIKIYEGKDIFILQYPKGNDLSFSNGKILSIIKDNKIIHNCSTEEGSSGSPIISRYSNNSIIGLHVGSSSIFKDNKEF